MEQYTNKINDLVKRFENIIQITQRSAFAIIFGTFIIAIMCALILAMAQLKGGEIMALFALLILFFAPEIYNELLTKKGELSKIISEKLMPTQILLDQ